MNDLGKICIFCGSSEGNDPKIIKIAKELDAAIANNNIKLIYGVAKIGIMGHIAEEALSNGGEVIGVILEFMELLRNYLKS